MQGSVEDSVGRSWGHASKASSSNRGHADTRESGRGHTDAAGAGHADASDADPSLVVVTLLILALPHAQEVIFHLCTCRRVQGSVLGFRFYILLHALEVNYHMCVCAARFRVQCQGSVPGFRFWVGSAARPGGHLPPVCILQGAGFRVRVQCQGSICRVGSAECQGGRIPTACMPQSSGYDVTI